MANSHDNQPGDPSPAASRLSKEFKESNPPEGGFVAAGDVASSAAADSAASNEEAISRESTENRKAGDSEPTYPTDYHFPPRYAKGEAIKHFLIAAWRYTITPVGFLVVIYGLNVVAWGGMLFLLLCNASPAMCYPTCDDINSPRRKWLEYASQILTVLFCFPAFGLAPWRFRDLWYLMKYRLRKDQTGLRRLGGIHRDWFRLPGSHALPVDIGPHNVDTRLEDAPATSIPFPATKVPDAPLTGVRAPDTAVWKMDAMIWLMVWNTFFQCVLCGVMWGMNRYVRPSWTTGLFVALGCVVAIIGGLLMFFEGKNIKGIEGVPLSDRDREKLARDQELGVAHYNNIKDKAPKAPKASKGRKGRK